jgi:uncharacterized protein YdgA (DUF945 family)
LVVRKGFVALLLVLAVVVLVSPGIVGKIAEQSMHENLEFAATEANEVTITSQGFDRGWFSSAGQHRLELRDGELYDTLLLMVGDEIDALPALIIDTHIDHGIVPVTSMTRAQGSLAPGLGSAVSTLTLELADRSTIDLPGAIYSEIGLSGALTSKLVLEPGSFADGDETAHWGAVDIEVTTNPTTGVIGFGGDIDELLLVSPTNEVSVGAIAFDGERQPTRFGVAVGEASFSIDSITMPSEWGTDTLGPVVIVSSASASGDLLSGQTSIRLDDLPFGELGRANIHIDASFADFDGQALGNITRALDGYDSRSSGNEFFVRLEDDVQRLLAAGLQLRFSQFDIIMQPGTVSATLDVDLDASDINNFAYASALQALDARLDLSVPAELYDYAVSIDPQVSVAVGMGYLRRNGGVYEMQAAFQNSLLTINGAPMPIPLPGGN